MTAQLRASHLKKIYKKREIVSDVSLNIHEGEVVGLLGPNGAGKTTCFYMIVGLIPADGGTISVNGQDITSLPIHARAKLGINYLPQESSIFRKLTVAENLMAILELRPELSKKERLKRRDALMDELRITEEKDTLGMHLSGGERRRTEIARTLATDPKYILLDEPFAGIDPISVLDVKRIITQLRSRGIGILITDHNVRDTLHICERAYIVNEGRVLSEGSTASILANEAVRQVYLGEGFEIYDSQTVDDTK
jgi:lipopolysaccharide export system ATP-binding protein